jgi:hypothetical protein
MRSPTADRDDGCVDDLRKTDNVDVARTPGHDTQLRGVSSF